MIDCDCSVVLFCWLFDDGGRDDILWCIMQAINFKIIVLGAQGVGKSSLITRYIKGQFQDNYHVTVGVQFATKMLPVESGDLVRLQIWDTAGQQFFRALVRSFYKGIAAVFFIFAVDRAASLKELEGWVEEVKENAHEEAVMFVIGSRADEQAKREVSQEQAAEFLKKINGAFFVQTSAKSGLNIQLLFEKAADMLYKKYKTNGAFAQLVSPDGAGEVGKGQGRTTRGQSIVLRRETIPDKGNRRENKKCCE